MQYVPEQLKYLAQVKRDWNALDEVPAEFKTKELYAEAVKAGGFEAFVSVPDELKTTEMCLDVVSQYSGRILQYVPNHLKTEEICFIAVCRNRYNFRDVPEQFYSQRLCDEIIRYSDYEFLNTIKTASFWIKVVKNDFHLFKYVPDELKTADMCLDAVKKDGNMLLYVPDKLKTTALG